jgi:virginiamycin B lyase
MFACRFSKGNKLRVKISVHRLKLLWIALILVGGVTGQEANQKPQFPLRDAASLPIVQKIHIGGDPDWLGIGFGSVWVSVPKNNEIVRVSPVQNIVQARVTLEKDKEPCYGIGIGPDRVWVLNCQSQTLTRIDPHSNKVDLSIPVRIDPSGEGGIAVSRSSVWFVSNEDGHSSTLTQINSHSGSLVRKIAVGKDSAVVKLGFASIWVISSGESKVYRVNPRLGKVTAAITVHARPRFATVGAGSLWVLSQSDGSVSRIDPVGNKVRSVIQAQIPGAGGEIGYGGGFIWATMNGTPVIRIDPLHDRVVDEYNNYKNADAIRFGFSSVWVSDHGKGDLWKIDPHKMPAH